MKKLSLRKKLLLAGSLAALAIACQSKPVHRSAQPTQPLHSDVEEECDGDEDESSFWDQTEPFKAEEKQLKSVNIPSPSEAVKMETPRLVVVSPAESVAAPVVDGSCPEVAVMPAVESSAPVVETNAVTLPSEPVVEVKMPEAVSMPVDQEVAVPALESDSATIKAENDAVSESLTPNNTAQ